MTDLNGPAAVLTRLLHATDDLDWAGARACLGDQITTDYTELFGGDPNSGTRDELIDQRNGLLPGFDATQHMTGPILIEKDGDGFRADTHVRANHHLGGATWSEYGHYRANLQPEGVSWRIVELTLQLHYQDGDTSLLERAAARAGTTLPPLTFAA